MPHRLVQSIFVPFVLIAQLCPTLCDPMDCSPLGSSVHEILQARILEWVAISFSRGCNGDSVKNGFEDGIGGVLPLELDQRT